MKRTLTAAAILVGALSGSAWAQGAPAPNSGNVKVTTGVDIPSVYYFRGIRQEFDPKFTLWPYGDVGITLASADTGLKSVGVNFGVWNSLHTGTSGSGGAVSGLSTHYEEDFYSTLTLGFNPVNVAAKYIAYTSPNGSYPTIKEMDLQVTGTQSYAPYGLIAFELSDNGQADLGADRGTYFELGAGPNWPLGGATLTIPVSVGLSLNKYYETAADPDNHFGFFDLGLMITVPFSNVPAKYGSWNVHGRADYLRLGDGTAAATPNGKKNQGVVMGGIGFSY